MFNLERFVEDGLLIAAGKGAGKTTLAKKLYRQLRGEVKVVDISRAWNDGVIPNIYIAKSLSSLPLVGKGNIVYDLSRLAMNEVVTAVNDLVKREWLKTMQYADRGVKREIVWIFEEAHIYIPNGSLRANSKKQSEVCRLVTVGRNYGHTYMAITQRPQYLDTGLWDLCGQRFIGRVFKPHPYFRNIVEEGYIDSLPSLPKGKFIYQCDGLTTYTSTEEE